MTDRRFRLEFLVKAKDWQDVVKLFKDELNITNSKRDASDRKINGYYLVHVYLDDEDINKELYMKIGDSKLIALSYDPKGKKIRDDILNRVCIVEHDLRKLLLNISDLVENYFKIFDNTLARDFAKQKSAVRAGDVNPITSYLTLDDEIRIFSVDLWSWNDRTITANDLLDILNDSNALDDARNTLAEKLESKTIWSQVDKYILKSGKSWEDILPHLDELKKIRNKAAHFRIVTESDLEEVKKLSKIIGDTIRVNRTSANTDLQELRKSIQLQTKFLSELTKPFQQSIMSNIQIVSPDLQEAIHTLQKSLIPNLPKTKVFPKQIFETNNAAVGLARTIANGAKEESEK